MDTDIVEMRLRATRVLTSHHEKSATPEVRGWIFTARLEVITAGDKQGILRALRMITLLPSEVDYIFGTVPPEETN